MDIETKRQRGVLQPTWDAVMTDGGWKVLLTLGGNTFVGEAVRKKEAKRLAAHHYLQHQQQPQQQPQQQTQQQQQLQQQLQQQPHQLHQLHQQSRQQAPDNRQ